MSEDRRNRPEDRRTGLNAEEPAPKPGAARPTWELVIEDMTDRDDFGSAKYGVHHQHDNGRDHLVDAYQEQLDHVLYLRAELERRKECPSPPSLARLRIEVAKFEQFFLQRGHLIAQRIHGDLDIAVGRMKTAVGIPGKLVQPMPGKFRIDLASIACSRCGRAVNDRPMELRAGGAKAIIVIDGQEWWRPNDDVALCPNCHTAC